VTDEVALHRPVLEVDKVEALLARWAREVGDADHVARPDLVLVERCLGAGEQLRINAHGRGRRLRLGRNGRQRIGRAGSRHQQSRQRLRRRGRRKDQPSGAGGAQTQHFPPIQRHSFPPL